MTSPQPPLESIYNFRAIGRQLGTAGQPTEAQFADIRNAGYDAVINLALPTSDNAISNEGSIVTSLGMSYFHIPVNFQSPTPQDFNMFCGLMSALRAQRVFIHCAANKRVSIFVFLYRVLRLGIPREDAEQDMDAIWEPDEVWSRFVQEQLASASSR